MKNKLIEKLGLYIAIGLVLFIGLKSFISTGISFDNYILLECTENNGQQQRIILSPNHEMIVIKTYQELVEFGVFKINGSEAIHYISDLYCIHSFPFGLRFYMNAEKVYDVQIKLSKKNGDSFPSLGESINSIIIIYPDKVKIGDSSYKRLSLTESEIEQLKQAIKEIKLSCKE